jgi:ferredoxin
MQRTPAMTAQGATWTLPLIDLQRCTGCGLCEQLCPTNAVEVRENRAAIVRPEACSFCDVCESYCPEGAIGRPFTIVFAAEDR